MPPRRGISARPHSPAPRAGASSVDPITAAGLFVSQPRPHFSVGVPLPVLHVVCQVPRYTRTPFHVLRGRAQLCHAGCRPEGDQDRPRLGAR